MAIAYLNEQFLPLEHARISPLDRGFLFADGVYEVIPAYAGKLFRLDKHLQRLAHSLAAIEITNPHSTDEWTALFEELIQQNGGGNIYIYLQVTRGATTRRDHAFPNPPVAPTVFAMTGHIATPAADMPDTAQGVTVVTLDDIRWSRCDIKSVALLANILMRQQAVAEGAAEAILIRDGFATEGSASNFFIVKDGLITTPPKSHLILPGITRDLVVELAQQNNMLIEEREVTEAELRSADEIWLSSSTKEVVPVTRLNGHTLGDGKPGPLWKQMARHYVDYKRRLCGL
ncbi:D-amino-acid transaminase [Alcanivorax sp. 1008]|uniref:D-amino-acid transaminase n=1 Tax=Alcanivorax sp. 1008 TaxID=2816853 RepID=UPI001DDE2815|nr:D-amino-acid transaminase [Alcanivorax sp. 1008]MCC1497482.1 D-amino-acid transaminase [Alcanivorax sp. 1008]